MRVDGEFDLNTLRLDGEIFESAKKKLRIQKYPDTCGRGLSRPPDVVNPLSVSIQPNGEKRLILDLRYISNFLIKRRVK